MMSRLMKAPIQPWTTFMEISKVILHQKAHIFQLKMFATYPNTIRNCAIKDRTASIKQHIHTYNTHCHALFTDTENERKKEKHTHTNQSK